MFMFTCAVLKWRQCSSIVTILNFLLVRALKIKIIKYNKIFFLIPQLDFYAEIYFFNTNTFDNCFQNIPPDLSQCVFVIEQALSVRALQELVTAAGSETVSTKIDQFYPLNTLF